MATERPYEIVLLGATGYTGRLTAEYITKNVATDLRWAIAGRNHKKLSAVVEELKEFNSDRKQPDIEVAELNADDLHALAKKTKTNSNGVICFPGRRPAVRTISTRKQ